MNVSSREVQPPDVSPLLHNALVALAAGLQLLLVPDPGTIGGKRTRREGGGVVFFRRLCLGSGRLAQRLLLLQQELLQGAGQIVHEVPTVGDLHGLRSALCGGLGVRAAAVPGYDLYLWMAFQPGSYRLGLPAFQKVDHLMPLQVHDHGPVATAAPEGPVVYPDGRG